MHYAHTSDIRISICTYLKINILVGPCKLLGALHLILLYIYIMITLSTFGILIGHNITMGRSFVKTAEILFKLLLRDIR